MTWCKDCGRAHTDAHDATLRGIMGPRGTIAGIAFAYGERCGEMHYTLPTPRYAHSLTHNGAYHGRERRMPKRLDRTRQPKRVARVRSMWDVRTHAIAQVARTAAHARAFALTAEGVGI